MHGDGTTRPLQAKRMSRLFPEGVVQARENVLNGLELKFSRHGGRFQGSLHAPAADDRGKFFQAFEEGGELGERKGVGAVGQGFGGRVVRFLGRCHQRPRLLRREPAAR